MEKILEQFFNYAAIIPFKNHSDLSEKQMSNFMDDVNGKMVLLTPKPQNPKTPYLLNKIIII